jgi:hypothetical protein
MIALPFLSIRSRNRFGPDLSGVAILGYPFIGRAPVERLAASAPGLDRSRNSDFGRLGRLIVGGFLEGNEGRSRLTLRLPGLCNNASTLNHARPRHLALEITATFSAPSSAMVARALR